MRRPTLTNPRRYPITTKFTRPESAALKLISRQKKTTRSSLIREYVIRCMQAEQAA